MIVFAMVNGEPVAGRVVAKLEPAETGLRHPVMKISGGALVTEADLIEVTDDFAEAVAADDPLMALEAVEALRAEAHALEEEYGAGEGGYLRKLAGNVEKASLLAWPADSD